MRIIFSVDIKQKYTIGCDPLVSELRSEEVFFM